MAVAEKAKRSVQRKRKPKILAVINDACTGCGGSPICITECPVDLCMYEVQNPDAPFFNRVDVDPLLCIGCKKCTTKGFKLLTDEIDQDKSSNYINPDPYFAPGGCVSR